MSSAALESKDDVASSSRLMIEEIGAEEEKGSCVEAHMPAPAGSGAAADATPAASEAGAGVGTVSEDKTGSGAACDGEGVYTFEPVSGFAPTYLTDSELKLKAKQWNLDAFTCAKRFRFHQKFDIKQVDAFLTDLFSSDSVQRQLQVMGAGKDFVSLSGRATGVTKERVPATVLTMEFWDRCQDDDIVTPTGYIRKCMEDVFDGVTVGDELRRMFIDEDSEHVDLYSDDEKQEFMYCIMKAIAIGGPLCQYDDRWDDYLKATKATYKDLLTVYKDADSGEIRVSSLVFRVSAVEGLSSPLFPSDNPHSFCYVVVDALKRQATVWYGGYLPFW